MNQRQSAKKELKNKALTAGFAKFNN